MRPRLVAACALALTALLAAQADARTYCRLAKESPDDGDPHWYWRAGAPFGPWDLKSLDVASSRTHLTGVVRVADLTPDGPRSPDDGALYRLHFSAGESHHYVLVAEIGPGRQTYELWQKDEPWPSVDGRATPLLLARAAGVADAVTNEIRMTVPLSVFGKRVARPRTPLSAFGGESQRRQLHTDDSVPPYFRSVIGHAQDEISSPRGVTYPLGAPSCVKVRR